MLFANDPDKSPLSWSPDGQFILYTALDATTGYDFWVLPLSGERKSRAFVRTTFNEPFGQFSPDGKWVVYQSSDNGRGPGVYVAPFPGRVGRCRFRRAAAAFHDGDEMGRKSSTYRSTS